MPSGEMGGRAARPIRVLVDVPCLAYRAYHTTGMLSHDGKSTGVVYGVLREILALQRRFDTDLFAFAFDSGNLLRKQLYPAYKANRHKSQDDDEYAEKARELANVRQQIAELRDRLLPTIGYQDILFQDGFEADDMIAAVCMDPPDNSNILVVSSDNDLWQLLGRHVRVYDPRKKLLITSVLFRSEWGISPTQWADVKALAGCGSDNIKGVRGVGEKTAVSYLTGRLKPESVVFRRIVASSALWERNLQLVRLPFEGVAPQHLCSNRPRLAGWRAVLAELGIRSFGI